MDGLLEADYKRVAAKLKALTNNPRPQGCEKLSGDIYRVRVGGIRIIYMIDNGNNRIEVGGIRRRGKSTYKGIDDLFG
jgi:mRNA interferase RelE/StbE